MKKNTQELQQLKDKTFILSFTIPQDEIAKEYQHVLSHASEHVDIKGFRKGKAPTDVVESHIDPQKVLEQAAETILSKHYSQKVKQYNLKPVIQPQVKILNPPATQEKDWDVEITACELPVVTLDKIEEKVKKIKVDTAKPDQKDQKEAKLNQIFDILLANTKVELPPILIDADVQSRLSQLIDQVSQAGLTVENYLKSKNTTIEKHVEVLKTQITKEWTLNLAIDQIAQDQKIEVTQKEIEDLVSRNPQASTNVNMLAYVLRQQKVINYLESLA